MEAPFMNLGYIPLHVNVSGLLLVHLLLDVSLCVLFTMSFFNCRATNEKIKVRKLKTTKQHLVTGITPLLLLSLFNLYEHFAMMLAFWIYIYLLIIFLLNACFKNQIVYIFLPIIVTIVTMYWMVPFTLTVQPY